ncbi:MAG: hypothetical protein A3J76_02000 [Candidatus Moranbacteria bacterium RBG_13_45_13]|nr:MAG: hypothetical protein A3J76_02000 [Candidatus Moranbacteria bacterium RBG_13_45_13]
MGEKGKLKKTKMAFNSKIKTYLDQLATSPKRPNSYLFVGPAETEKSEAAVYFAAKIAGKENDGEFLRRAEENIHPDVVIVEPEIVEDKKGKTREKEIVIEQIRQTQERLKFFPYELKQKFCLIRKAGRLNLEAGNALLKILEEPTESTFFILLAVDAESVLPTIASRSAILRFPQVDLPKWKEENRERLRKIFKEEVFEQFGYIEKTAKDKNELLEVLIDWENVAAESLRKLVADGENQKKAAKVAEIIGNVREAINRLEYSNASPRAVGENLMLEMNS